MKILLVNPYIYDFTAYDLWLRPLGLLYVAAVIKDYSDCELFWLDALDRFQQEGKAGRSGDTGRGKFRREIVPKPELFKSTPRNYARYGIPLNDFLDRVENLPEIDLILVTSLMTYWIDGLVFTLKTLSQRFPKAKTVLGGIIPTLVPESILAAHLPADHYIKGCGESQILQLIAQLGARTFPHPDFSHIDHIPLPAVELLGDKRSLPLLTSRGCPFRCTYCASSLLNPAFLERSTQAVIDEIYHMHESHNTTHFAVFDDALLINKHKRFFKVFDTLKAKLDVSFHTPNGLHPGEIDEETAGILFKKGFQTIRLSLESTNREILSRSSHKVTPDQLIQAADNLEKAGYKRGDLGVYLLFGLPGQTIKEIEADLLFARDLGVVPHLAYFSPVPGTPEFIDLQTRGILSTPVNLLETNKIYFLYNKSGFSHSEIAHIKELTTSISRKIRNSI